VRQDREKRLRPCLDRDRIVLLLKIELPVTVRRETLPERLTHTIGFEEREVALRVRRGLGSGATG
jgi:hypothetical protein